MRPRVSTLARAVIVDLLVSLIESYWTYKRIIGVIWGLRDKNNIGFLVSWASIMQTELTRHIYLALSMFEVRVLVRESTARVWGVNEQVRPRGLRFYIRFNDTKRHIGVVNGEVVMCRFDKTKNNMLWPSTAVKYSAKVWHRVAADPSQATSCLQTKPRILTIYFIWILVKSIPGVDNKGSGRKRLLWRSSAGPDALVSLMTCIRSEACTRGRQIILIELMRGILVCKLSTDRTKYSRLCELLTSEEGLKRCNNLAVLSRYPSCCKLRNASISFAESELSQVKARIHLWRVDHDRVVKVSELQDLRVEIERTCIIKDQV